MTEKKVLEVLYVICGSVFLILCISFNAHYPIPRIFAIWMVIGIVISWVIVFIALCMAGGEEKECQIK